MKNHKCKKLIFRNESISIVGHEVSIKSIRKIRNLRYFSDSICACSVERNETQRFIIKLFKGVAFLVATDKRKIIEQENENCNTETNVKKIEHNSRVLLFFGLIP